MTESLTRMLLAEQEARVRRWTENARSANEARRVAQVAGVDRPLLRWGRLTLHWAPRPGVPR